MRLEWPKVHLACLEHDSLVQRQALIFVIFPEKDAEQDGIADKLHRHPHPSNAHTLVIL